MKIIDDNLNGHSDAIIRMAKARGLDLALACALVEQESGGRNIFGCDHGGVGDEPPYCGHEVTKERVAKLRDGGEYSHGLNGIGLTQITWWEFVEEAEALGGAHIPEHQCNVGFKLLAGYLNRYPYYEALAAYNAGESNRFSVINTYAVQVAERHEKWKKLLPSEEVVDNGDTQSTDAKVMARGKWLADKDGNYLRMPERANSSAYIDKDGYLWISGKMEYPLKPVQSGTWLGRHPTRYVLRKDVFWLAQSIMAEYNTVTNTYVDHPEGWGRDLTSFDCWGLGGRGDPISLATGRDICKRILGDPTFPYVDWLIFEGYIWMPHSGWVPFVDDGTGPHFDHVHVTFK